MSKLDQQLPDPRLEEVRSELRRRIDRTVAELRPVELSALLDPIPRQVMVDGFQTARADEGTLWWVEEESLVPVFNTGPHADRMVGQFRQPLSSGLICMVFATEQPFIENAVYQNARQSKMLDDLLQVRTWALMAVPFVLEGGCRGVLSCVQLKPNGSEQGDPSGFGPEQLSVLQRTAAVVARWIEFKLLTQALGWRC